MSQKRSAADRSNPVPPPADPPKREEMREIERGTKISSLPRRQQSALPIIAATPTLAQAARSSGIGESTLYRWLQDDRFRDELTRLRQEASDLAKKELQGATLRSVSTFAEALEHPDMAIRLRSARCAMSFATQISEVGQLRADLQGVEEAIPQWTAHHSPNARR